MCSRPVAGASVPSNHSALSRFLNRLLSRSVLSDAECEAVLGLTSHAHQVRPNYDIITPGQTVAHACLVANGTVARYDQMNDGRRQLTAFHIAGDMCDLHSVVCPTAAWGLLAMSTVTILNVPHCELKDLALRYPNIAMAFWRDSTADASILAKMGRERRSQGREGTNGARSVRDGSSCRAGGLGEA